MKFLLKTNRIEALSDGIFAISMTLLVMSFIDFFSLPQELNNKQLCDALKKFLPDLFFYSQSFLILGGFWNAHHKQFHFIIKSDNKILLINLLAMMFIGLIPFSTLLVGDFYYTHIATLIFESNLFITGMLFYANWYYASYKRRLISDEADDRVVRYYREKNLVIPLLSVIAMILSIIRPDFGAYIYFLAPVCMVALRKKYSFSGI